MEAAEPVHEASRLMNSFAARTGLGSNTRPRRYLWTDAFAVCNFLGLAQATDEQRYAALALELIEQVHQVLGAYHPDDARRGWLSGLDEPEAEAHPTRGGLRIGKPLPERGALDPFDERLEWQRDGQYFHYATKWMHALDQTARWTGQPRYNTWARELAKVSHDAFAYSGENGRRMVWKMSTDLSRPLVPSMGHHDPLDGFITCIELQATASQLSSSGPSLEDATDDFARMMVHGNWATMDPLGLGGLLMDASRVAQLVRLGGFDGTDLLRTLLAAALEGLQHYARQNDLREPASRRLAFRELGLAIGLSALELVEHEMAQNGTQRWQRAEIHELLSALGGYVRLSSEIQACWLDPAHRRSPSWTEHRDINDVMLATSLLPAGFVVL
jgi:hypothetical protein